MKKKPKKPDPQTFDFFEIDRDDLVSECVNQPKMYFQWATQLAGSKQKYEIAKAALDVASAELSKAILAKPAKYDLKKTTDAVIKAEVMIRMADSEEVRAVNKAKYEMDIHQAAVNTMDHRKRSLQDLVNLEVMGYHAEVKPSKGHSREALSDAKERLIMKRTLKERKS